MIPLSSVVGSPLSVSLLGLDGLLGLHGWQWLFLAEGFPACVMGVLTLLFLRDNPRDATWLTTAKAEVLDEALMLERTSRPRKAAR